MGLLIREKVLEALTVQVAQDDFRNRTTNVFDYIFRRDAPVALLVKHGANATENGLRFSTAQHIASGFDRFRPFGDIANRDIGHFEDAAFFLNRAAIAQHTESFFLESYK